MSVFRTASKQAVLEMIEEIGLAKSFGIFIAKDDVDKLCNRVVDLFEMTLELRERASRAMPMEQKSQHVTSPQPNQKTPQNFVRDSEIPPLPRTRRSAEILELPSQRPNARLSEPIQENDPSFGTLPKTLPRRRVAFSTKEQIGQR